MRIFTLLLFVCSQGYVFSQARIVFNGAAYVNIENNAKVVVANGATDAIVPSATGGFITESEFDQVVWMIGANSGNYTMPFVSTTTLTPIPFNANLTAPGVGVGTIWFSTYPGNTWDNNTYRPIDVTHMFDYWTGSVNNSDYVIDRFWIIDAQGYATRPTATFSFTYRDPQEILPGNSFVEANLGAQRFNNTSNIWGDYLPQGTTNTALNVTSGVPVIPSDFFRSWTLSDINFPLNSTLESFVMDCDEAMVNLEWSLLNTTEAVAFEIDEIQGGSSTVVAHLPVNGQTQFQASLVNRGGVLALYEVYSNGQRKLIASQEVSCEGNAASWISSNGDMVYLNLYAQYDQNTELTVVDMQGKLVHKDNIELKKGINLLSYNKLIVSHGAYYVYVTVNNELVKSKIIK